MYVIMFVVIDFKYIVLYFLTVNPVKYIEQTCRYIDSATIQEAYSQNLRPFFEEYASKFPPQRFIRLRKPKQYAQHSHLFNAQIQRDMLSFQNVTFFCIYIK